MTVWTPEWRLTVNGVDYTNVTLSTVSITTGRTDIYSQPVAGYANIEVLNLNAGTLNFNINDGLAIQVKDSTGTFVSVFGGFITDVSASVRNAGSSAVVTSARIVALGALARLPKALTLGVLSKDLEGVQIKTILEELLAGQWNEVPAAETWSGYDPTVTWANAENLGLGTIDAGQYEMQSRSSSETDIYSLVSSLATSGMGYLWEDAEGRINYADTVHRQDYLTANGYTELSANQALTTNIRTITRAGDVRNSIALTYKTGTATASDATSIATYGKQQQSISTSLEGAADATSQANRYLALRAYPRAIFDSIEFSLTNPEIDDADRDALLNVFMGQPIQISNLPDDIAGGVFQGYVEGWSWRVGYNSLSLIITASPIEFSQVALRWNQVSVAEHWNTLSSTLTWEQATGQVA